MTIGIVVAVIVVIVVLWLIIAYNGFIRAKNNVEEGFSTMDVYLKKRFDLIPNLVETVKGYTDHEAKTLEKVVSARSMVQNATNTREQLEGENALSQTLHSLFESESEIPRFAGSAAAV